MFFRKDDGELELIYSKENLACPLMLFNATVPLYDGILTPETVEEEHTMKIRELERRIAELEQRNIT